MELFSYIFNRIQKVERISNQSSLPPSVSELISIHQLSVVISCRGTVTYILRSSKSHVAVGLKKVAISFKDYFLRVFVRLEDHNAQDLKEGVIRLKPNSSPLFGNLALSSVCSSRKDSSRIEFPISGLLFISNLKNPYGLKNLVGKI
jgi:hypothetical protein